MRIGNSRRHSRIRYTGSVRLSWDDHGEPCYVQGKCVDLSAGGLRVEAAVGIPLRSRISFRVDELKLSGSGLVKHVARRGAKCILGLELSQPLHEKVLAAIPPTKATADTKKQEAV